MSRVLVGGVALVISYGAYVAEVFRAGIESIHPSQLQTAAALGLSRGQTMRLRRRPPGGAPRRPAAAQRLRLAAEGHRAGLGGRASSKRCSRPGLRQLPLQRHPLVVAARFFIVCTVPLARLCDRLQRRGMERERAGRHDGRCWRSATCARRYGDRVVLADVDLTVQPHDVICLIGSSGLGQVHAAALHRPARGRRRRRDQLRRPGDLRPAVDPREVRKRVGMVFQAYNLFPHLTVLENCTLAPSRVPRRAEARPWTGHAGC